MVHSKGIPMPLGDWNRHHPSDAPHHHHHHHHHHPSVRDLGVGPPHGLHHDFHPGNPLNMAAGLPAHSHPQVLHHHASTLDSLCYGAPPPNYLNHHLAEVPHPPPPPPPPPPQQHAQQQQLPQQQQPPPPPTQQQHQHPPQQQIPVSSGGEENPDPTSVTVAPLGAEVKKPKKKRKSSFSVGQVVDTGVTTDNKCPQCFKLFNTKGLLTQHLLVHTNVRRFPCDFCEKAFKQKAHLETHKRIHTGDKPYKCQLPNCEKSFAQMTNLKTHMKHHENQLERKLAIEGGLPAPKKEFPDDDRIDVVEDVKPVDGHGRKRGRPRKPKDEHIHWRGRGRPRNDGNDANLQDPYYSACAGVAGERVTLQLLGPGSRADGSTDLPNTPPVRPPPTKREKKNNNASFDGSGFSSDFNDSDRDHPLQQQPPQRNRKADKLEARKSTTTGGDVTCEVCYKIFRTKGLLTQHMLVHNNVRRFVCDVCEKGFKQKAHLKTHTRLHTGEKPYTCSMPNCERQFAQATNLKLHLRSHENRLDRVVLSIEPAGENSAAEESGDDNIKAGYQRQSNHNDVEANLDDENHVKTDLDEEEEHNRERHHLASGFSAHSSPPPSSISEHQQHHHPHNPQHQQQHQPHLHHLNPHLDKLLPHQIQQQQQQQHLQPQHHSHPQHSSPPLMATNENGGNGLWSPRDHQVIAGMVPVHDHIRDRIMAPHLNDDKGH